MTGNSKEMTHVVAFAQQHRSTVLPTFDAHTALFRARNLLEDVEYASRLHDVASEVGDCGRLSGLEITDYYAVGYVTCLEWHARSRRADLLNFMPELIQQSMMNSINKDAISQMTSAKVTLGDLIGASTKINSLKSYTDVFDEIWRALLIDVPLPALTKNAAQLGGGDSSLHDLFVRRHSLVHEIGIDQVGSYVLRYQWTFSEAIDHGKMIIDLISSIERQISKFAPDLFPNRLDDDGYPVNQRDVLQKQLVDVEGRVAAAMMASGGNEFADSQNSSELYSEAQTKFVDVALIEIPKRHYDPTPRIVDMLYRQRLELLSAIAKELDV